mmetsp:Transcript_3684/g.8420  ORF Transcript_3684/g.8420 Transcript_3684/m.8420 type:complete len:277 (-) Transcript_3684:321-1151(-)
MTTRTWLSSIRSTRKSRSDDSSLAPACGKKRRPTTVPMNHDKLNRGSLRRCCLLGPRFLLLQLGGRVKSLLLRSLELSLAFETVEHHLGLDSLVGYLDIALGTLVRPEVDQHFAVRHKRRCIQSDRHVATSTLCFLVPNQDHPDVGILIAQRTRLVVVASLDRHHAGSTVLGAPTKLGRNHEQPFPSDLHSLDAFLQTRRGVLGTQNCRLFHTFPARQQLALFCVCGKLDAKPVALPGGLAKAFFRVLEEKSLCASNGRVAVKPPLIRFLDKGRHG